jgi:hypothetical protein
MDESKNLRIHLPPFPTAVPAANGRLTCHVGPDFYRRGARRYEPAAVGYVYAEEYAVHRVMRQFGLFQESPVPAAPRLPPTAHR